MSKRRKSRNRRPADAGKASPRARPLWLVGAGLLAAAAFFLASSRNFRREKLDVPNPDTSAMEKQVADAIGRGRENVKENPSSPEEWGRLGMVFHAHGLTTEAAFSYLRAAELAPRDFRWPYLLAQAIQHKGIAEALSYVEQASLLGNYAPAHILQAQLLEQGGKREAALEQYEKALSLEPECAAAELGLGRLKLEKGDFAASLGHLKRARNLQADSGAVRAFLARAYSRLGDRTAAAQEADKAKTLPPDVIVKDPVIDQMWEEAVSTRGYQERAVRAEQAGDYPKAERLYKGLLELHPEDTSLHYNVGNMLFRHGKLDEAEPFFRKALELDPTYTTAQLSLVSLLISQERHTEALRLFKELPELQPHHAAILIEMGEVLASQKKTDQAADFCSKALKLEPQSPYAHHRLGQLLAQQQKFQEAVTHYRAALEVRPHSGLLHRDLASALAQSDQYRSAWEHARVARELGETPSKDLLKLLCEKMPESAWSNACRQSR